MSVETLVLEDKPIRFEWNKNNKGNIEVKAYFGLDIPRAIATFDRNQAHLLKLWLEDQLK